MDGGDEEEAGRKESEDGSKTVAVVSRATGSSSASHLLGIHIAVFEYLKKPTCASSALCTLCVFDALIGWFIFHLVATSLCRLDGDFAASLFTV